MCLTGFRFLLSAFEVPSTGDVPLFEWPFTVLKLEGWNHKKAGGQMIRLKGWSIEHLAAYPEWAIQGLYKATMIDDHTVEVEHPVLQHPSFQQEFNRMARTDKDFTEVRMRAWGLALNRENPQALPNMTKTRFKFPCSIKNEYPAKVDKKVVDPKSFRTFYDQGDHYYGGSVTTYKNRVAVPHWTITMVPTSKDIIEEPDDSDDEEGMKMG